MYLKSSNGLSAVDLMDLNSSHAVKITATFDLSSSSFLLEQKLMSYLKTFLKMKTMKI